MPSNHIGSETTIVLADPLDGLGTVSVLSQARRENTGIHADGRRSVRMRSPAWSGRIGSWLGHAMSLRRAGTFSPVHAVFSHPPENVFHGVSDGLATVPPQTLRNTAETRGKPFWKAFSRVISQVCLRIGENATRGHPSNATARNALNPTVKRAESLSSCDWA